MGDLAKAHWDWERRERNRLQRDIDYAASIMNEAQKALDAAERHYGDTVRAMETFKGGFGR